MVAQYNISIAHALGVARYRAAREEGALRPDARIGIVCNFSPSYTKEDPSEADLEALRMNDGLTTRLVGSTLATKGSLPRDVLETLARLGTPVPARPGDEWGSPLFAEPYIWPERVMNESRGWEIYPKGIYDFGMKCRDEYPDLEWFVSESGIGIEREYLNKDPETPAGSGRLPRWTSCATTSPGSPAQSTTVPSAGATTTGASSTTGLGRTPSRTATASSRSTSWRTTTAGPRSRRRGSGRSSRRTW